MISLRNKVNSGYNECLNCKVYVPKTFPNLDALMAEHVGIVVDVEYWGEGRAL
jgi:hypothetical protein